MWIRRKKKWRMVGLTLPNPNTHYSLLLRSLNGCDCVWITIWAADERILKSRRRRSLCLTWQENFWVQDKEREEKERRGERERVPKAHSKAGSRGGSLAHSPRKQRINSPVFTCLILHNLWPYYQFFISISNYHINITIKLLILNIKV